MRNSFTPLLLGLLLVLPALSPADDILTNSSEYQTWIEAMKTAEHGPFSRLRWFCNDGEVLPPKPYACKGHGGGYQHGQWNDKTLELRKQGYLVANLLAGQDSAKLVDDPGFGNAYAQILMEKFLVSVDDG